MSVTNEQKETLEAASRSSDGLGGRLIINNRSHRSDVDALNYVYSVMVKGRISGDSYCYATVFENNTTGKGIVVYADRNKKSDTFTVADA